MKIILVGDQGASRSLHITRHSFVTVCVLALMSTLGLSWYTHYTSADQVNAQGMAYWQTQLAQGNDLGVELSTLNQAQSAAIGRQLAQMQARLLRIEALGAHMIATADLQADEFDFDNAPAQGGPVSGVQASLEWSELTSELARLSAQLRRRETELNILDDVLVGEGIQQASEVKGRPVNRGWVSSSYGRRVDPITGRTAWHAGVDFAGRAGSDVIAVASGVVTYAGELADYGQLVELTHRNGLVTRYGHHKSLLVDVGDVVKSGEAVGIMGSTGRTTGPHVHFEVLKDGRPVNPAAYIAKRR